MKPRPHAELIHYWADGGEVQKWREYLVEDSKEITKKSFWQDDPSPTFSPDNLYRRKPENKNYYRVAKFYNHKTGNYYTVTQDSDPIIKQQSLEDMDHFNGWLTDWIEYE